MLTSEQLEKRNEAILRQQELAELTPIDFETFEKEIKKWLLIKDEGILKLLPAVILANRLSRDPVWLFLIGASGGGKTELLTAFFDLPDIYPISLITPNTFLSGMPGKGDMSLLPKITGMVVIFKDWTNISSQNRDARNEIMGQLREIYDGQMKKIYGNGKIAEWKGKIGLIAGTTPAIDLAQQMHATLGERFIHYRLEMPDRKEAAMRALSNGDQTETMRKEMKNAACAFFKYLSSFKIDELPAISHEIKEEIVRVADFATRARSGVIRDSDFKKEIIFVPAAEMPTRITQQLTTIAAGLTIVNDGKFIERDMRIIYKVALDSIPQTNRMVMMEMAKIDNKTTAEIAAALGYPTAPIRMYLENLAMLKVCQRKKASDTEEGGVGDRWHLLPEFVDILKRHENLNQYSWDVTPVTFQNESEESEIEAEEVFNNL